ncbi:MAG TPA: GlsB/YeaQ/YmgE family stress response membrane protein [Candidatus Solibacter sp.]|jgi:uncharacterized membrane protein YeaQ/YmgE (transglycosylase-associated protein family)|nr:GlsB/YeaQ/YmgE family stress response membrane protein [Candidatus Solibacter sp.]
MMLLLPAVVLLEPGGLVAWLLVGLIAGALAGRVVEGRGLGCLGDIIVGVVGAFIGGFIVNQLGIFTGGALGFLETLVVAFFGAVVFLALIRLVTRSRRP